MFCAVGKVEEHGVSMVGSELPPATHWQHGWPVLKALAVPWRPCDFQAGRAHTLPVGRTGFPGFSESPEI